MNTKTVKLTEATRDELFHFATVTLGASLKHNTGPEKIIAAIKEIEGEDIAEIEVQETLPGADAPQVQNPSTTQSAPVAKDAAYYEEKITIKIPRTEAQDGSRPVFAGCNGKGILIPRGKPVLVARKYIEILNNATQTRYRHDDEGNVVSYDAQLYPFQVVMS